MYYPTLQSIKERNDLQQYDIVPICKEIFSDSITAIEVMRILKNNSSHCYMLESVEDAKRWGRYTFLGFQPKLEITCRNGQMKVDGKTITTQHPKQYIREVLKQYRSLQVPGLPTFTGGLVGYFGYDYFKYSEPKLQLQAKDKEGFNDVDVMLFDQVICFDNDKQKIILIVNASLRNIEESYLEATKQLEALKTLVLHGDKATIPPLQLIEEVKPLFSENEFCNMVEKAKNHIKEGDIFQVVLSNRLQAKATGSLFDVYRMLRTTNPSPYMFYFSSKDLELAGASPETLIKMTDHIAYTYPLAGTRPRGKTDQEDQRLQEELLKDQKELAEHNMLVDLGRNDLGKISTFGSVVVEKYQAIEKYSHVMHIASTIRGEVKETMDAFDAIDAILPAGTLSGAPKIKAMEIIDALENNKRGIYGGAIGYIDFTGNLDTCIAIRLAYKKQDTVFVRSGAGIVYDSEAKKEYQECLDKAGALLQALKRVDGGIDNDSHD